MLTLFVSSLFLVFLLGLQQQNVTHEKHGWSVLTSFLIAAAQVAFIQGTVAMDYWESVAMLGLGGAIGASASIVVHKCVVRRDWRTGVIGKEL